MPVIERVRGDAPGGRHRDDDPAQPRPGDRRGLRPARRGARRRAAGAGRGPPPRAARRRERRRPARRAQPRPGRRPGWGSSGGATGRARVAASILDADLVEPRLRRPPRPEGRAPTGSTSTSWTATSSRTSRSGPKTIKAPAAADRAAVRRPPDDQRAGPLHRRVPRRRLRLDHVPRRDRRADRADPAARSGPPAAPPGLARQAGHAAVARSSRTSELLDIVMVMTVEPGFGGQSFMKDVAREKLLAARDLPAPQGVRRRGPRRRRGQPRDRRVRRRARRRHPRRRLGAVHQGPRHGPRDPADPGARRRGLPVHPQRRRAADPARQDGRASPRCRSTSRSRLMDEIEAGGVPVVMLRGDGQMNPDGVRDYDLLVPGDGRGARRRAAHAARATRYQRGGRRLARGVHPPSTGSSRRPADAVRALLQRDDRRRGARRRRGRRGDRAGAGRPRSASARTTTRRSPTSWRAGRPSCASSATTTGRTNRSLLDVGGERARRLAVHAVRGHAARSPAGVHRRGAARARGTTATSGSRTRCAALGRDAWRPAGSVPRWRSSSSTTARSRSGCDSAGERPADRPGACGAVPSRATSARLGQRAPAAGADERLGRRALLVDDERLEVRLHSDGGLGRGSSPTTAG